MPAISQYLNILKKLQACLLSIVSSYPIVCTEDVKCSNCGKYSPDQHHTDNHAGAGGGGRVGRLPSKITWQPALVYQISVSCFGGGGWRQWNNSPMSHERGDYRDTTTSISVWSSHYVEAELSNIDRYSSKFESESLNVKVMTPLSDFIRWNQYFSDDS